MAAPKAKTAATKSGAKGKVKLRKKEKKNIAVGQAHIKSTFNNTIISITDMTGAVISWASSGQVGYKGSRKSTPFAAQLAAEAAARRAQEHGLKKVDVFVKGPGSGRETAIRSLQAAGLEVGAISDVDTCSTQWLPSTQATSSLRKEENKWLVIPEQIASAAVAKKKALSLRARSAMDQNVRSNLVHTHQGNMAVVVPRNLSTCYRCVRSRSALAFTAYWREQFRGYYEEANRRQGKTGGKPSRNFGNPSRQCCLPCRLCKEPRHGAPVGSSRTLPC